MKNEIVLKEFFDREMAIKLLDCESINKDEKRVLRNIINKTDDNFLEVKYIHDDMRRMTASVKNYNNKITPYQNMNSVLRAHLADKYYYDIDIVNANYSIALGFFKLINVNFGGDYLFPKNKTISRILKYDMLQRYVREREQIFISYSEKYSITKDDVKQLFLELFNFGSRWKHKASKEYNFNNEDFNFMKDLQCEISSCLSVIYGKVELKNNENNENYNDDNKNISMWDYYDNEVFTKSSTPDVRSFFDQVGKYKHTVNDIYNYDAKTQTWVNVIQTYERMILIKMKTFFEKREREIGALIHDGLFIKKNTNNNDDYEIIQDLMRGCEKSISEDFKGNMNIKLKHKPFEILNFNEKLNDKITVLSDTQIAIEYFKMYSGQYIQSNNDNNDNFRYIYNETSGKFKNIKDNGKEIIYNNLLKMNLVNDKGKEIFDKTTPYCSAVSRILINPEIIKDFHLRFHDSTYNKVCFDDGYIDGKTKEFKKYVNIYDIVSMVKLPNYLTRIRNEEDIKELYDRVLNPIFKNDKEMLSVFLKYVARALFGHTKDKAWFIGQGLRNCGKGVLTTLMENTFRDYCSSTNSGNFMSRSDLSNCDEAAGMRWALQSEYKRFLFCNEVTNKKGYTMNGDKIKKFSGGDDYLEGRNHFESERNFKVQARLFLFCNKIPEIEPKDALETCFKYDFKTKFVSDYNPESNDYTLPADEDIKFFIKEDRICDAFLFTVIDHYDHLNKPKIENEQQKEEKEEIDLDNLKNYDDMSKISYLFEFPKENKHDNIILLREVYNFLIPYKINEDSIKFCFSLNGSEKDKLTRNKKTSFYFIGVKYKNIKVVEEKDQKEENIHIL